MKKGLLIPFVFAVMILSSCMGKEYKTSDKPGIVTDTTKAGTANNGVTVGANTQANDIISTNADAAPITKRQRK